MRRLRVAARCEVGGQRSRESSAEARARPTAAAARRGCPRQAGWALIRRHRRQLRTARDPRQQQQLARDRALREAGRRLPPRALASGALVYHTRKHLRMRRRPP
eukprot:scaffold336_cov384-Prasinococcus_capsulatus_cf.AAC.6